ncbi:type II secretion system F family protein [Desulfogranum japonicum]|uniref:type II secretion system F family protein n=1 Tax=Desulfogranum japonicum TaxID=231447 RepID=UPI000422A8AD|nr:type II secretion system F family protein [Desulfogranum japonicum]
MIFQVIICGIIFVALFMFAYFMMQKGSEESARRALGIQEKAKVVRSPMIRLLRPLFTPLVPPAKTLQSDDQRRKLRHQFVMAGMTEEILPEEFLAYQMLMAIMPVTIVFLLGPSMNLWFYPMLVLLGFFFPVKWMRDRVTMRSEEMVQELPHVVDILALSTRAGLGFIAGLERLTKKRKPTALMEELTTLLQEIQMGSTREQALRNMANRCDSPEVNQFIVVLIQASSLGVPISSVLRAQSEKMRSDRFQKAERKGAEATQKIVFPIILVIMPAVLIIVLGPIALQLIYSNTGF